MPIQYGFKWSIDGHVSSIAHHTARERVHACQRGTDVTHRKRRYLPQSISLLYTYAQLLKVPPVMDHAVMVGLAVKLCPISKIYRCDMTSTITRSPATRCDVIAELEGVPKSN